MQDLYLAKSSTPQISKPSPGDALGQISFAPATQTTVVTTTTTTTTSFPPLVLKAPRRREPLDPKEYPLAATPTPPSIKRLCFEVDGRPTYFREAEDPIETFQKLQDQQKALQSSGGVLESIIDYESSFQTPGMKIRRTDKCSPLPNVGLSSSVGRTLVSPPVSVAENSGMTSSEIPSRRHSTRRNQRQGFEAPNRVSKSSAVKNAVVGTPRFQSSTPISQFDGPNEYIQEEEDYSSPTWDEDLNSTSTASREMNAREMHELSGPSLSQSDTIRHLSSASWRDRSTLRDAPSSVADISVSGTATPPSMEEDRQTRSPSTLDSHGPIPRPLGLDTATTQDASLPSPCLSPVTAAAEADNERGYFEHESTGISSISASFINDQGLAHEALKTSQSGSTHEEPKEQSTLEGAPTTPAEIDVFENDGSSLSLLDVPKMLVSFDSMPAEMQQYLMHHLLRRCPKPVLHFVAGIVNPALQIDFLALLPTELCLNIISHLDCKSLCNATQVSKRWRKIIDSEEGTWKRLFDADGFTLSDDELKKGIREGWCWQYASRAGEWEKDLSTWIVNTSDTESTAASFRRGSSELSASLPTESTVPQIRRAKRKAATKPKAKPRKQQKRLEGYQGDVRIVDIAGQWSWSDTAAINEGPYTAANAAAVAVPNVEIGLPSLRNLHLFKSLYRRHHLIRRSWMDPSTKPRHLAFRAHQRHVVTCLQFDGDKILTGSDDKNINVYDTQTGRLRAKLEGHDGGVWALQYEGNVLVSGSTDRSVRVWDVDKGRCTQVFQGHTSTVRCLQILTPTRVGMAPDGRAIMMPEQPLIITGSRDSTLRVWKLPKSNDPDFFQAGPPENETDCPYFVRVLAGHHHSVRAIAAHADTLVSGSYDHTVRVWKISTGETLHRLQGHTQKVYSVVLDHKRNRCISGSMDNLVKVWSLETGSVLFSLEGHSSLVGLLDLQQERLVSAAADFTLRIWDPETGHCKSTLSAHTNAITCFQHDSQKVISGSDRTLKMWNVTNGQFCKDLLTDLSGVWQVKFNERRCVAAVQRNNLTYIEAGY